MSETAYFGGGCFWCIEAIYQRVKGVSSVTSGYAGGGSEDKPTYHNHGNHAEVVRVEFDSEQITYELLCEIFFNVHDPTTLNRQGNDVGPSYRSIILADSDEQLETAKAVSKKAQDNWDDPIVTEIKPLDNFTVAEDYHQDYFNQNPGNPYCQVIINPKVAKFRQKYAELLSSDD